MYDKSHPFLASIKERYSLSKPGSGKNTCHVVLDLKGSGLSYEVGDCLGVFPINQPQVVEATLHALKANGNETIRDKRTQEEFLLKDFLEKKANLADFSRKLLLEVAARQRNKDKKAFLENLLAGENKNQLKEYQNEFHVWDLLEDNQEASFQTQEFCDLLMPLLPRLYSIASSMKAVGEEVHLTIAPLQYSARERERKGVCSHYLCDLAPMHRSEIPVYIQPHKGFTVPGNSASPIIMVGPGTGIAPFRGFLQERNHSQAVGMNWLFFGEWTRRYEFFYEEFWLDLEKRGRLRIDTAFSRDQEHKVYVQHKMLEQGRELFHWLEAGAHLYVCGDAKRMARDVEQTLLDIFQIHGNLKQEKAKEYLKQLRKEKRYLKDVY